MTKSEFLEASRSTFSSSRSNNLSGNNKGNEWGVKLNLMLLFPDKTQSSNLLENASP